jgi:hypothetical protein
MRRYEREPHDPNQELIEAIEKLREAVEASTEHVDYLDNGVSVLVDELRLKQKSGQQSPFSGKALKVSAN